MTKHRRGPWSQAEDQYLTQLVHSQGAHNWVRISQLINSRSPKQCRERYHQNLKPSLNLSPITPEEGAMIERMVAEMGKRWAEIARRLNGRSDNAVKNWWNGGMNRRKRLDNRRDAAARGSANSSTSMNSNSARPPYDAMPAAAAAMAHASSFQQPFSVDAHHPHARLQPLPPPIITTNPKILQPQQRRFIDTPVPSPSTVSNISRNDSVDGPPSMISDMSSYSAQPQSPHTPYTVNGVELPPLPGAASDRSNSIASASGHMYHHYNNNPWAFNGHEAPDGKAAMHPQYQQAYYGYAPDDQTKSRMPMLPSQARPYEQLPLPSFRTVTAPDVRVSGPPSPHRDSRMSLRNVVD